MTFLNCFFIEGLRNTHLICDISIGRDVLKATNIQMFERHSRDIFVLWIEVLRQCGMAVDRLNFLLDNKNRHICGGSQKRGVLFVEICHKSNCKRRVVMFVSSLNPRNC